MEQMIINYLKGTVSFDDEITPDTNLIENSLLDSFGIIDLICFIETSFDVVIPDDEFDLYNFVDVNSIVRLIQRLIK